MANSIKTCPHNDTVFARCPCQLTSSEVKIWVWPNRGEGADREGVQVQVLNKKKNDSKAADIGASILRHTAGRIDAFLKIPSLIWVGLLQSTKIAIKFVACVITLNQTKHICEDWSFAGLERDTAMLIVFAKRTYRAAKEVILAPKENYKSSHVELFEGLGHVFGGVYHKDMKIDEIERFLADVPSY